MFNDVKIESDCYIHFQGKPLMSTQIDTLVITPTGVFGIEVKNWSREFAASGEAFSPFEQVSRASYLVYDRLRKADLSVKVRSIVATNGPLPPKGEEKVKVLHLGRIKAYIRAFPSADVGPSEIRAALKL